MKNLHFIPIVLVFLLQSCSFAYQNSPVRPLPSQMVDENEQIPSDTMVNFNFPAMPL